jgi:hypothetical protein
MVQTHYTLWSRIELSVLQLDNPKPTTQGLIEQLCRSRSGKRHLYQVTSITFISNEFKYDVYETSVNNVFTILFIEGQVNLIQIY